MEAGQELGAHPVRADDFEQAHFQFGWILIVSADYECAPGSIGVEGEREDGAHDRFHARLNV